MIEKVGVERSEMVLVRSWPNNGTNSTISGDLILLSATSRPHKLFHAGKAAHRNANRAALTAHFGLGNRIGSLHLRLQADEKGKQCLALTRRKAFQ